MSRCFPFPPPGYEKKPRTDDAHTLLIKETHKEKKHKKEKDKKKEGKEKKDKEGSKDKHREKKEKKEKHKERKKDKEKNKRDEKDKNKTDEKKIDEQPNAHNRGKHGENSHQVANIKDAKFEVELSQGIGDEERGRRNQMVEDFTPSGQREVGGMGRTVEKNGKSIQHDISDAKFAVEFNRRNQMAEDSTARDQRKIYGMGKLAEKRGENTHLDADTKGAKYAVEVSKKVADTDTEVAKYEFSTKVRDGDSKGTKYALEFNSKAGDDNTRRNRPTEHFQSDQIKEVVSMGRMLEKNNDARLEGKGVDKKVHDTKADRQGINDERRGMQVPIFTGVDPKRVEGMVGSMEKNAPRRVEGMVGLMEKDAEKKRKEKSKGKDGDDKQKNQKKDRNGEKKRKDKDKKHKVKDKDKIEQPDVRNMNQDGMKASLEEPTNVLNVKPLQIPINTVKSVGIEDNPKKRKDGMTNGFLHDNDRPTKLLKPTISSHTFNGNGKKLEPCQTTIQGVSGTQHGVMNNLKADVKEHKINGLLEAQHPSISSKPSSLANVQGSENGKAISEPKPIIEPPHPDSKYLNVVLSVPKMDEWSEFDDTEWLFSRNSPLLKKPNLVSSGSNEAPRVWDKAIQIDSADIFALPYVVPY